jgi:SAM-dependent methyltransferase
MAFGVEPNRRRFRLRLARYQGLAEAIADYVKGHPEAAARRLRLLDVGVGNGRTLRYLKPTGFAERIDFVGLDVSLRRLRGTYRRDRWTLVRADVERGLPLAGGSFDLAVCEQVLEHLRSPETAVAELARVLRPGGLLVVGVPVFPPGIRHLRRLAADLARRCGRGGSHHQTFGRASIERLVASAGFAVERCRGFRILSGGPLAPLEDHAWWYRLNRRIGERVPGLCTEVQLVARKRGGA